MLLPALALALLSVRASAAAPAPDYAGAVASFQSHTASQQVSDPDNRPFLMVHGHRTEKSILMVHGLSDGPYYMRTLAEWFYAHGYNVVGVLLPGHATRPEDLETVRLSQWEAEVEFGFSVAAGLGDKVSLAGFSTGAALALKAIDENQRAEKPRTLGDLFMFSPALKLASAEARLICLIPGAAEARERKNPWAIGDAKTPEDNPHRYRKMALNGVCQLYDVTWENHHDRWQIAADVKKQGMSVFAVESEADQLVSPAAVVDFMGGLPKTVRQELILYPKSLGIAHPDVTRPETNPLYGEMEDKLAAFVRAGEPSSRETLDALVQSDAPFGR